LSYSGPSSNPRGSPHAHEAAVSMARSDEAVQAGRISRPSEEPGEMTAGAVWIVALLGVVSGLLARAVEPALPGVWVGMGHVITSVKLASALASQLFAVGAAAMVLVLV